MRCCFNSVSRTSVLYTRFCIQPQIRFSTWFRSGLLGGHRSGRYIAVSPAAAAELSHEHGAPVCCPAETRTCHRQCDARLAASASSANLAVVSAVYFHPRLDEEQLSAGQFWDSNWHHQRRGERWPTTQQAFRSDVAQRRIARRLDTIVLQVDWRRYSRHMFVREEDEVDSMFQSSVVFETQYTAWLKRHNFRGSCFPRWCRDIS